MDFIIGILIIIIVILLLINFASVSMSNTMGGTCSQNNVNSMSYGPNSPYYIQQQYQSSSPLIRANSPAVLNNKLDMYGKPYDYNKYFFL